MNQSSSETPPDLVKATRRGRRRSGLRTAAAQRSALELILDFLDPQDWGRTFRLVVEILAVAIAVLGGLIGLAVVLGRISPGFGWGVGAGAGPLLAARLRQRGGRPEDDSHRPAAG